MNKWKVQLTSTAEDRSKVKIKIKMKKDIFFKEIRYLCYT